MIEYYDSVLSEVLLDAQIYGLYIFLPNLLALIFLVLHKDHPEKKHWQRLLLIIPIAVICKLTLFSSFSKSTNFELFIIFALIHAITIAIGHFFYKKKVIIILSTPLLLCCSFFAYATYEFFAIIEPFGRIENYEMPDHIRSKYDYTVTINYADAWGNNHYALNIRGKSATDSQDGDSIYFCEHHKIFARKLAQGDVDEENEEITAPSENQNCQWEPMADEQKETFYKFKELAEKYQQEYECNLHINAEMFNINISDYKKRTFRTLELGHASDQVPNALEIVNLGFKLIPFETHAKIIETTNSNAALDQEQKKHDSTQQKIKTKRSARKKKVQQQ